MGLLTGLISPSVESGATLQFLIFKLASYLFNMGLTLGAIKIILDTIDSKDLKIRNLFDCFQQLPKYVAGYLIFMAMASIFFYPFSYYVFNNQADISMVDIFFLAKGLSEYQQIATSVNWNVFFIFFVPVFIFWIKIQFFPYFIVSEDEGPLRAINKSYKITQSKTLELMLFMFILSLINILIAIFTFGLGLIFSMPFWMLATGKMFIALRKMEGQKA